MDLVPFVTRFSVICY